MSAYWRIEPGYDSMDDWQNALKDAWELKMFPPEDRPQHLEGVFEAAKSDLAIRFEVDTGGLECVRSSSPEEGTTCIVLMSSGGDPPDGGFGRTVKDEHRRWFVRRLLERAHARGKDLSVWSL